MREPVAWIQSNHLQLARQGVHLVRMAPTQHQSDYIPLFTADAIREAVLAEREACAKVCDAIISDLKTNGDDHRDYTLMSIIKRVKRAADAIRARGAA